ncbi:mycofactocin biosynthesis chaperone MftB [Amycolatopsis antarctica]|uniref:Mycofactocin biosynthesis chaperone MftB n=1 Tax=Amycolatopsis antarctica TaxID=1854586 RepID=A0A263D2T5_9PSEU|nr:mycofactocin biosynthesis chaperone MftB [Amycolatopsis antarctica]OZM71665.1 mycofactocin biosynthesis chaperone MftB [Amycolatopsis antarctica]
MSLDPDKRYRLNPSVALRPEPFGALAYHFGNRRLSFLKAPELVDFVRGLGEHPSLGAALRSSELSEQRQAGFLKALDSLAATDMIVEGP